MNNAVRIEALESAMRSLLASARKTTEKAKAESRGLTIDEKYILDGQLQEVERLSREVESLKASGQSATEIHRNAGGNSGGWNAVASALTKGAKAWEGRLETILGKAADVSDLEEQAVKPASGIQALLEDTRAVASFIPSSDAGTALSVESIRVDARGLAEGSSYEPESGTNAVIRSPLDTSEKAEADVSVLVEQVEMLQAALLSGPIANAAFRSVPELAGILRAALGRELDIAMGMNALATIEEASPTSVSAGSSLVEKLAYAAMDLRKAGARAEIALVSDEDAVSLALMTAEEQASGFPFGLQIAPLPGLASGEGFVLQRDALHLYTSAARLDVDNLSRFSTNESTARLEAEFRFVVREPSAIIALDGESG